MNSHLDDLIVEFLEDVYENDEEAARKARLKHLGYEVERTGDPLIDLWERQIARGETPDLDVMEDDRAANRDRLMKEAARKHFDATGERIYRSPIQSPDGVHAPDMDYTEQATQDLDRYLSNISPEAFDDMINDLGAIKGR